ncbi:hypothetical protein [Halanaerobium hydrogeniformans]|uniref:DUF4359 domain-containing protein n=1 Tax=Halanaerobium hydrogeniformans TaxID=656519 RepID=E4RJ38_HALHG|nr:hypothetical protein [Halanaerobium hydrogeniformans]ADQ15258.1 hypothetical protein Halsa_1840 [Halanaerobium hydrogeniformans]
MKKILVIIVIVLIVLLIAAATNPSRSQFIDWSVDEIASEAESELQRIFEGALSRPMLEMRTDESDYLFFSIFTVETSDSKNSYLGIFNNFFNLN